MERTPRGALDPDQLLHAAGRRADPRDPEFRRPPARGGGPGPDPDEVSQAAGESGHARRLSGAAADPARVCVRASHELLLRRPRDAGHPLPGRRYAGLRELRVRRFDRPPCHRPPPAPRRPPGRAHLRRFPPNRRGRARRAIGHSRIANRGRSFR